jgi:hypothetical protein
MAPGTGTGALALALAEGNADGRPDAVAAAGLTGPVGDRACESDIPKETLAATMRNAVAATRWLRRICVLAPGARPIISAAKVANLM